jgi:hypothetical protein
MIQLMKTMTIRRQFAIIVVAFSLAMPTAVCGLSWVFGSILSETRRVASEDNQQSAAIFSLIGLLDDVQAGTLRLVREKDPDKIEELMEHGKKLEAGASEAVGKADDGSGKLKTTFENWRRPTGSASTPLCMATRPSPISISLGSPTPRSA